MRDRKIRPPKKSQSTHSDIYSGEVTTLAPRTLQWLLVANLTTPGLVRTGLDVWIGLWRIYNATCLELEEKARKRGEGKVVLIIKLSLEMV